MIRGKRKEMGSERRAAMGCGNGGEAEDAEGALCKMSDEMTTINTTLMGG